MTYLLHQLLAESAARYAERIAVTHTSETMSYGELEAALYTHPAVKEAAAVAIPDEEVGNRIKAVIVPSPGSRLEASEIKRLCIERLPRYMVPEEVEFMAALPRTATGKIDRLRLADTRACETDHLDHRHRR